MNPKDFLCSKCGKYACYEFHQPTHVRYCESCFDSVRKAALVTSIRGLANNIRELAELISKEGSSARDVVQEIQTPRESAPPQVAKVAAVSFIEREDGRLLCVWNKRYGGWSLPGGMVEDGETVDEGQARELREETSLETLTRKQIYYGPSRPNKEQKELKRASFVYIFRVTTEGTPREVESGCPVTWLTREEFLKWSKFRDLYVEVFKEISNAPTASVAPVDLPKVDKEKQRRLRESAEKATSAWWSTWMRNKDGSWTVRSFDKETNKAIEFSSDDMVYMAAASPQTILALLNRIDELENTTPTPFALTCKHSTDGGEGACVLCLRTLLSASQAVSENLERDLVRVEKERDALDAE